MSMDYAIWKWKKGFKITPGFCFLALNASIECEDVDALDTKKIINEICKSFPGWDEPDGDCRFECEVSSQVILLQTYASTQISTIEWFKSLAKRFGLIFRSSKIR